MAASSAGFVAALAMPLSQKAVGVRLAAESKHNFNFWNAIKPQLIPPGNTAALPAQSSSSYAKANRQTDKQMDVEHFAFANWVVVSLPWGWAWELGLGLKVDLLPSVSAWQIIFVYIINDENKKLRKCKCKLQSNVAMPMAAGTHSFSSLVLCWKFEASFKHNIQI